MRLFRYFDEAGGLATLKNRQLRLANPQSFNDPFELTPFVVPLDDDEFSARFSTEERIEGYFAEQGAKSGQTKEQSRDEYLMKLPTLLERKHSAAQKARFSLLQLYAQRFRILCLSHTYESILMWSHYAQAHTGMVIEIETDEISPGEDYDSSTFEVKYRTAPFTMPSAPWFDKEFLHYAHCTLSTKALPWSYEEEVRIQFPIPDGHQHPDHLELSFSPLCVKRVILGCRWDMSKRPEIEELMNQSDYAHTRFQGAYEDDREFRLGFIDLPVRRP